MGFLRTVGIFVVIAALCAVAAVWYIHFRNRKRRLRGHGVVGGTCQPINPPSTNYPPNITSTTYPPSTYPPSTYPTSTYPPETYPPETYPPPSYHAPTNPGATPQGVGYPTEGGVSYHGNLPPPYSTPPQNAPPYQTQTAQQHSPQTAQQHAPNQHYMSSRRNDPSSTGTPLGTVGHFASNMIPAAVLNNPKSVAKMAKFGKHLKF